ncbi:MAG: hypothetical protein ACK48V_04155 [Crocinitomicaceae bacterium]
MSKQLTNPILFENTLKLDVSSLKKWGYLENNEIKTGIVNWCVNGNITNSISIKVNNKTDFPFIEFAYRYNEEIKRYKIFISTLPSNLNKGHNYYFTCSISNKRCRKLYLINGIFSHRKAFIGCMYKNQTMSKKTRLFEKTFGMIFKKDEVLEQLNKKWFKYTYSGKPTKKYLKLYNILEKSQSVSIQDLEEALLC